MNLGIIDSQLNLRTGLGLHGRINNGDHVVFTDGDVQVHISTQELADRDVGGDGRILELLESGFGLVDFLRTDTHDNGLADIIGNLLSLVFRKKNLLAGVKFIGKNSYTKSRTNKEYADAYDNNAFYSATKWNTLFELFDDKIND